MAGLLVAIAVMGITMSMVMPTWRTWAKREKEAELIFRGEQYMRAIELYQRRFVGAYPTDVEALIDQRFLRKAFTDPITGGEFEILTQASLQATPIEAPPETGLRGVASVDRNSGTGSSRAPLTEAAAGMAQGAGGIIGVVSSSTETSMALRNGRNRYDEWLFVYLPQAGQPGLGAAGAPPQGGGVQPGPGLGGAFGGIGGFTGQPGGDARGRPGRGGQGPGRGGQRPGAGAPPADGPGLSGRQPDGPGASIGTPPRR